MPLGDFQRVLVEQERGAAVWSQDASHLAEGCAVKFRETASRRVLPVEGRTTDDLCFPKSFLGDDAAVLARSSGEEPTSPRHRAGVASMAWRTTR